VKIIQGLGLPYMGSKRKLAHKIINRILKDNPNTKYFYDLFGGGGAISFNAIQRPKIKQVFYNEFNAGVVALLKDLQQNGFTETYYQWIDRETFHKHKDDNDWFGGLCSVVWSFGNNQKNYLFSADIEPLKKKAHEMLLGKTEYEREIKRQELSELLKVEIPKNVINGGLFGFDMVKARKELANFFVTKVNKDDRGLQRLQQLQQLQRLEISNLSYDEVEINTPIDETIIYLDPPYANTAKYQKDIDHDKLKEYIHNSPYKIYLSSYENVYDMHLVEEYKHRSSLSATANNEVVEKLFCNKLQSKNTKINKTPKGLI